MLECLQARGLLRATMDSVAERIDFYLQARVKDRLTIGAVVFSEKYGILCTTGPADRWLRELEREHE